MTQDNSPLNIFSKAVKKPSFELSKDGLKNFDNITPKENQAAVLENSVTDSHSRHTLGLARPLKSSFKVKAPTGQAKNTGPTYSIVEQMMAIYLKNNDFPSKETNDHQIKSLEESDEPLPNGPMRKSRKVRTAQSRRNWVAVR